MRHQPGFLNEGKIEGTNIKIKSMSPIGYGVDFKEDNIIDKNPQEYTQTIKIISDQYGKNIDGPEIILKVTVYIEMKDNDYKEIVSHEVLEIINGDVSDEGHYDYIPKLGDNIRIIYA